MAVGGQWRQLSTVCRAAEHAAAARRELEDLRAAVNFHRREGLHDKIVSVVLPRKSLPRERWLTRDEAAVLIRAAWRYREKQNHRATDRHTRRHIARFMVVARYMGSRAGVICGASIAAKRPAGRPWVDLATGVFYGRAAGERPTRKRKQTVRVPLPLLAHMRRWHRRGQRFVVEWNGRPVSRIDKAHRAAVADAGFGQGCNAARVAAFRRDVADAGRCRSLGGFRVSGDVGRDVAARLRSSPS